MNIKNVPSLFPHHKPYDPFATMAGCDRASKADGGAKNTRLDFFWSLGIPSIVVRSKEELEDPILFRTNLWYILVVTYLLTFFVIKVEMVSFYYYRVSALIIASCHLSLDLASNSGKFNSCCRREVLSTPQLIMVISWCYCITTFHCMNSQTLQHGKEK